MGEIADDIVDRMFDDQDYDYSCSRGYHDGGYPFSFAKRLKPQLPQPTVTTPEDILKNLRKVQNEV